MKELSGRQVQFTFHLSPGTPAMSSVWLLLGKTTHPAELIDSSPEQGVRRVDIPFEISAEFLPQSGPAGDEIIRLVQGLPPEAAEFVAILHKSQIMKRVIAKARRVAVYKDVPVLIQGESGTGKELIARAIHASSARSKGDFVPVNCGAIPAELFEAEFFGTVKGAFTGAIDRHGHLENANGGTLFLDEVGELPLAMQVKLLRALQERIVQKIGSTKQTKLDLRLIAATNRNLLEEVAAGRFRDDLFHRIAVAVLQLPPLRERHGDLNLIVDSILEHLNTTFEKSTPGWKEKRISTSARNLLLQHSWPGNVRELMNTLSRAVIWSTEETISAEEMRQAIVPISTDKDAFDSILDRPLGDSLSLPDLIAEVAQHYLKRALQESNGNKSEAAQLVGLPSYQTLTNWLSKYGSKK